LPSATLNMTDSNRPGRALYEPIHGSAPDIAGFGMANPLASILSFGMCLNYSLNEPAAADLLNRSIRLVLGQGLRTADIATAGDDAVSSAAMTDAIIAVLGEISVGSQRMRQA